MKNKLEKKKEEVARRKMKDIRPRGEFVKHFGINFKDAETKKRRRIKVNQDLIS